MPPIMPTQISHAAAPEALSQEELENQEFLAMHKRGDQKEIEGYYSKVLVEAAPLFDSYAGVMRPQFEFTTDPSIRTAAFYIDQNNQPRVKISYDFVIKNKLSAIQVKWIMLHELTHFKDNVSNPEYYKSQFDKAKRLGGELVQKLVERYKLSTGKEVSVDKMKRLSESLGKIYSGSYYNIILDIFVNHNVATLKEYTHDKSVVFSGHKAVEKMYKNILFGINSITSPRSRLSAVNYTNWLILGENVGEVKYVTDGVPEELEKVYKVKYQRHEARRGFAVPALLNLDAKDLINILANPNMTAELKGDISANRLDNKKDTSLKYRHEYLDATLLVTFTEMLERDMDKLFEEYDPSDDDRFEELMKILGEEVEEIESHSPDFIPGEVKESYSKWYEGEMKKAKDLKTWAEQNKVSEDVAERVIAAKRDVSFYVKRLSELWRRITTGRGSDIESVKTGGHKSGTGLDVDAFIKQAPSWLSGNYNDLKVMNQREAIVAPSDRPLRIEISLMIDQSISMGEDHKSEKNKLVERVSILLNESIDDFNMFLMSARERSKSELHADTEVIVFGNEAEVVQPFRYTKSGCRGADADRRSATKGVINFNTFKHIGTPRGYTYDNEALTKVEESMTHQELARIKESKTLKIAFLITDGGSSNPSETFKKIEELTRIGVQVFAFQIGEVNDGEKVTFENTWNKSKDGVKRGYVVGEDFGLLPDLVAKMLEKYLGNVKIYK